MNIHHQPDRQPPTDPFDVLKQWIVDNDRWQDAVIRTIRQLQDEVKQLRNALKERAP